MPQAAARTRGVPVVHRSSGQMAALAVQPHEACGDADDEWLALLDALHALRARDWPAVIVPVSGHSLAALGFADRVDDLVEQLELPPGRLWIEVASSREVMTASRVVTQLARGHMVGVQLDVSQGFRERGLVPDLAALGVSFAWLVPADGRSVADDLSGLIIGRSLVKRAQAHGMAVIAPGSLEADLAPPTSP